MHPTISKLLQKFSHFLIPFIYIHCQLFIKLKLIIFNPNIIQLSIKLRVN